MGMKNIPEPAQSGSGHKCGVNEERQHRRVFICGPTRCWELYQLRKMDVNLLLMKPDACSLVLSTGPGPSPEPGSVLGLNSANMGTFQHLSFTGTALQEDCKPAHGMWGGGEEESGLCCSCCDSCLTCKTVVRSCDVPRQRVFIRLQKRSCFSSAPRRIGTLEVPERGVWLSILRQELWQI